MNVQAIIPTAGLGTRFPSYVPKPLLLLKKKPIFVYALETFQKSSLIDSIVLVVPKVYLSEYEKIVKKSKLKKVSQIIAGGATRAESVFNGVKATDEETKIVLIHDGVRPFVTAQMIRESIAACRQHGSAVVAVPVKPTIKKVDPKEHVVEQTLNRDDLWEIQTPQVFKKDILLQAYRKFPDFHVTDEAYLVERLGVKVKVVLGSYKNIKITTPEDLVVAEALRSLNK